MRVEGLAAAVVVAGVEAAAQVAAAAVGVSDPAVLVAAMVARCALICWMGGGAQIGHRAVIATRSMPTTVNPSILIGAPSRVRLVWGASTNWTARSAQIGRSSSTATISTPTITSRSVRIGAPRPARHAVSSLVPTWWLATVASPFPPPMEEVVVAVVVEEEEEEVMAVQAGKRACFL